MEEKKISRLTRELKLKQIQFNSIFEFSESIYSSFQVDNIVRIYFSTLLGQLGISRIFFFDAENQLFEKRGFKTTEDELTLLKSSMIKLGSQWFNTKVEDLAAGFTGLKDLLKEKKIHSLVNVSESEQKTAILGLGAKLNLKELTTENIEYAFVVSKFSRGAIENALLIDGWSTR